MTKNPEVEKAMLTQAQTAALPLLAAGAKKKDAAAAAGVCAQTVSEWLQEPHFSAALEAQRTRLASLAVEQMKAVIGKAVEAVAELMESNSEAMRFKAATYFLDRVIFLAAPDSVLAASTEKPDTREFLAALGVNC
jgi:hypothetical protein